MQANRTLTVVLVVAAVAAAAAAWWFAGGAAEERERGDRLAAEVEDLEEELAQVRDDLDRALDPRDGVVTTAGTDSLRFEPSILEVIAGGATTVRLECSSLPHSFNVERADGDLRVAECASGETAIGTVTLAPGEYVFYCAIPGHREAGMEGVLTAR